MTVRHQNSQASVSQSNSVDPGGPPEIHRLCDASKFRPHRPDAGQSVCCGPFNQDRGRVDEPYALRVVWQIELLGPLEVKRDGQRVDVPSGRASELLVRLALEAGHLVRSDRLI